MSINNSYSGLTLEDITKALREVYGFTEKEERLTYSELSSKILDGYQYRIHSPKTEDPNSRSTMINTGRGGVLMMLDAFKDVGLPPGLAQRNISVFINGEYVSLDKLNKIRIDDTKEDDPSGSI